MSEESKAIVLMERLDLRRPRLIAAFTGWADAGEVASGSLRYLTAKLGARRIGHIEQDEFYEYTTARPLILIEQGAIQLHRYQASELFCWRDPAGEHDLLILLAGEPQLRWGLYVRTLIRFLADIGAEMVVSLGGLYDAVPHTVEPRISGLATSAELRERLRSLQVALTEYQGPGSIHTALLMACQQGGIPSVSLWGHNPIYVRTVANPKVCHALLSRVCPLLGLPLNLAELKAAGEYLDETLNRMLAQHEGLRQWVQRLQEQSEGTASSSEPPAEGIGDTERIIREVEEFLRREQRGEGGEGK